MGDNAPRKLSNTTAPHQIPPMDAEVVQSGEAGMFMSRDVKPTEKLVSELEGRAKSGDVAAVKQLIKLARSEDTAPEALKVLRAANCKDWNKTSITIVKFALSGLGAGQKQGPENRPVRQNAPATKAEHTRYKRLIQLLKSEFRGRTNPLRNDPNSLTKISGINNLNLQNFHKDLESKQVAEIAVAWFEELEKCGLEPTERIRLQTGLASVLNELKGTSIRALEEFRESRTSNTSEDFFKFLKNTDQLNDEVVMRLRELNKLFHDASLDDLSYAARKLDAGGVGRLKELRKWFKEPLWRLSDVASDLDAEGMGRLDKLRKWFENEPLKELYVVANLSDAKRMKELEQLIQKGSTKVSLWPI